MGVSLTVDSFLGAAWALRGVLRGRKGGGGRCVTVGLRLFSISPASSAAPAPTTDVPAVPSGFKPLRLYQYTTPVHSRATASSINVPPPTTYYRFTISRYDRFHSTGNQYSTFTLHRTYECLNKI
ncbi:hypothetical protein BDQ17DRAFT_525806 [Cyathus striatus]|nr:hypothetical protein BDQ17DRAFT_525806 [Cyathus striatus]